MKPLLRKKVFYTRSAATTTYKAADLNQALGDSYEDRTQQDG
jgi:hypothetical protein